jgi:4'-phosphopantetheinyl transferase
MTQISQSFEPAFSVFWMTVADDFPCAALVPRLNPADQVQATRLRPGPDRDAYVAAHALLTWAITKLRTDFTLQRMPSGKIALVDDTLHVSLSHTNGMVAVVTTAIAPVGIDVEPLAHAAWAGEVADLNFHPLERAWLDAAADEESRADRFFGLWTLKEAVVKATGQGTDTDWRDFAVALDPPRLQTHGPDGSDATGWFILSACISNYRLAVASNVAGDTDLSVLLEEVTPAHLLLEAPG